MSKQSIGTGILFIVVFICGGLFNHIFAITKSEQRYNIGFATGCKDGQAGKDPDPTQYDRVGGFSNHSIQYNNGYIDGYNRCSTGQVIDPFV